MFYKVKSHTSKNICRIQEECISKSKLFNVLLETEGILKVERKANLYALLQRLNVLSYYFAILWLQKVIILGSYFRIP